MRNTYSQPHWSRREEDRWREGEEYNERAYDYDHHYNSDHGRGDHNPLFTVVVKLNHSGHDATDAHNINTQVLLSMKVILT